MSEQRILREIKERIKEGSTNGQIDRLQLDSISIRSFTREIKNLIESYSSIDYLTANDCELISLNHFPKLPNLTILQLSNNKIPDDELFHLLKNSHISHLMIDDNMLKSIEKVSILRQLPNLEQLEIASNLMGDSDFYREELFDRIPQLKIIDCKDKDGNVAIDSDSESEDEENLMIALGGNDEKKGGREKSVQSGDIGDHGERQLLHLLGEENISDSQDQDSEEKDKAIGKMQSKLTSETLGIPQNLNMDQQQEEDEKSKKKVKPYKQCSMQNRKTSVVDLYDQEDYDSYMQ